MSYATAVKKARELLAYLTEEVKTEQVAQEQRKALGASPRYLSRKELLIRKLQKAATCADLCVHALNGFKP